MRDEGQLSITTPCPRGDRCVRVDHDADAVEVLVVAEEGAGLVDAIGVPEGQTVSADRAYLHSSTSKVSKNGTIPFDLTSSRVMKRTTYAVDAEGDGGFPVGEHVGLFSADHVHQQIIAHKSGSAHRRAITHHNIPQRAALVLTILREPHVVLRDLRI